MIAITGASGFIGRELVARARDAGREVLALSRTDGSVADYENAGALARAFQGAEAVVHVAARAHRSGSDEDFECNVRAARAVTAAARSCGLRRVVLLSSIGVNGNVTHGAPFTEADVPAPVEPYARSKLRAEHEVRAGGVEWVVIRPPLVYGPNAPGNFGRLVRAVARGWPLPLASVQNRRSLVGVGHLCDFILSCVSHPSAANELFLVADGEALSTPQIVRSIARGLGTNARLWPAPPALLKAAAALAGRGRAAQSLCDSLEVDASKARRLLGWSPAQGTSEGLERMAAQWRFER